MCRFGHQMVAYTRNAPLPRPTSWSDSGVILIRNLAEVSDPAVGTDFQTVSHKKTCLFVFDNLDLFFFLNLTTEIFLFAAQLGKVALYFRFGP